jgi:lipopolysaccharide transport system ATP-binding protein
MSGVVIRVEQLGKSYRLGEIGGATLREDLNRWWQRRRARSRHAGEPVRDTMSALEDVSFDVREGEIVGIVGRNGAGKSTLLKILSRITAPTTGRVKIRGRVGSLLEVGTGFHPELSGRENIYLNGAILGMKKRQIDRRLDEIVDFAEIAGFIDTPVKRYSSGMYVRLAFAVAAHLEPEILIVDEVLAVGDAAFQKKCLGKMQDVSQKQGRTVLFVSHNMAMVSSLCQQAILLDHGRLAAHASVSEIVLKYGGAQESSSASVDYEQAGRLVGGEVAQLLAGSIRDDAARARSEIDIDEAIRVRMDYRVAAASERRIVPNFHFFRADGTCAFVTSAACVVPQGPGVYRAECRIPANFLNDGLYSIGLALSSFEPRLEVHFNEAGALMFNVRDPIEGIGTRSGFTGPIAGAVRPTLEWTVQTNPGTASP